MIRITMPLFEKNIDSLKISEVNREKIIIGNLKINWLKEKNNGQKRLKTKVFINYIIDFEMVSSSLN